MFLKTWQKKSPSDERGLGVVGGRKREREITSLRARMLFLYFADLALIRKRLDHLIPG